MSSRNIYNFTQQAMEGQKQEKEEINCLMDLELNFTLMVKQNVVIIKEGFLKEEERLCSKEEIYLKESIKTQAFKDQVC